MCILYDIYYIFTRGIYYIITRNELFSWFINLPNVTIIKALIMMKDYYKLNKKGIVYKYYRNDISVSRPVIIAQEERSLKPILVYSICSCCNVPGLIEGSEYL